MGAEVQAHLAPQPGEVLLDATVGRGGHCGLLLPTISPGGRYVGLDVDPANLAFVRQTLGADADHVDLLQQNFGAAPSVLDRLNLAGVDMVLADLGFSSNQLADPARGLSFAREGPLDMRLDPTLSQTAADLLARLPQRELADVLWRYGDERLSRPISRKIVERRRSAPITTTAELADVCCAVYGPRARRQRIHPATRTFMALRIAVNDELGRLEALLGSIPAICKAGARVVVISFHSLEDRAVKQAFRKYVSEGGGELLTAKPLRPTERERRDNPRSRSAKFRAMRWQPEGAA
jgi:16S rRNA (cytosine1402-N4)-methyltransferase